MSESDQTLSFKQLPKDLRYTACLLLGFVLFMIWDQSFWWGEREDYSFGYLVPLFVGYVLYDRWSIILSYMTTGHGPDEEAESSSLSSSWEQFSPVVTVIAVAACIGGLALYSLGALMRSVSGPENPISLAIAMGFVSMALGALYVFSEKSTEGGPLSVKSRIAFVALFLFPVLIWLISAPLVGVIEKKLLVFLQSWVASVVFNSLDMLGFEIQRNGSVLVLRDGQEVGVEEACSGIRSLTACIFAGSFFAAVFLQSIRKKLLLIFAAMGLAVLTNLMRSLFLTLWAYYNGADAIDEDHVVLPLIGDLGSVHDVAGMAILGVTCLGLLCLLPVFNFKLSDHIDHDLFDDEEEVQDQANRVEEQTKE